MIFLPVIPMPMPRTISPKMRKIIDLFFKGIKIGLTTFSKKSKQVNLVLANSGPTLDTFLQ